MKIRIENTEDLSAIRAVHLLAFPTPREANLVENLRNGAAVRLSMVAEHEGAIVAHVLFSPVLLGEGSTEVHGVGLGPIGVLPHLQRQGIGTQLIRNALEKLQTPGCSFAVVLGSPQFCGRFGFEPARSFGVHCKWDVPAAAFMMLPFDRERVRSAAGLARYRGEFDALA